MPLYTNWNGSIIQEYLVHISPGNQSFRYGDGCFETMKMINGGLILQQYHFDRLYGSLDQLKIKIPTNFNSRNLQDQIVQLAQKNGHENFARIRLTIYREGESFAKMSNLGGYIIQTIKGEGSSKHYNAKGLRLGIYKDAKKSCDNFSPIKSNNYLPYVMAKIWATENNLDDALVCNSFGRVADSTIANIFIVENGIIKTPPITEGCINGVMRKYLLHCFSKEGLPYKEEALTIEQTLNAAEVFLTNAIRGISWVEKIDKSGYTNNLSALLYKKYIAPLFNRQTI